jgi:hypothetical protein
MSGLLRYSGGISNQRRLRRWAPLPGLGRWVDGTGPIKVQGRPRTQAVELKRRGDAVRADSPHGEERLRGEAVRRAEHPAFRV